MKPVIAIWVVICALIATIAFGTPTAYAERLPIAVQRGHIIVQAAEGLEREAALLANRAEVVLPIIAADLPDLTVPTRVEIRLVHDSADLPSVAPAGRSAPRWAAGVAYPGTGVVAVAVHRGSTPHDVVKTLDHELAHLALDAALPNAPRWLHEGFAWQHAGDLDLARSETLTGMAWFGSVIPLEELESGFPAEEAPASRAYAESYDFVGYLAHRGRWTDAEDDGDRWPFRRFLRAIATGASLDDAAVDAYGVPLDQLFLEGKSDLVRRYLTVPTSVFASALWILAATLLVLAFIRRRSRGRAQMERWTREDDAAEQARKSSTSARPMHLRTLPHVPWPGSIDPLDQSSEREGDLDDLRTRYPDAVIRDSAGDDDPSDDDAAAPKPPRWIN